MVDAQAAQILATTDQIAERVRKTGNTTLRSVGDIGRHQSLKANDKDFVKPDDMLVELRDDNLKLVEIGRASCRERVCQYVWISVVGVSLKTKEEQEESK